MRYPVKIAAITIALGSLFWGNQASATFFGMPRTLKPQVVRLNFQSPSLAPMAFTMFCLRNPDDCRAQRMVFRPHPVKMNLERWFDLVSVNADVNDSIAPQADAYGEMETWKVAPAAGNCHDYAVTKRHELLEKGWPAHALILSEVVTSWGEHHLVLVVRTAGGDLVLDSLHPNVRPLAATHYRWVRAQSPKNPNFWSTVSLGTKPAMVAARGLRNHTTLALRETKSDDTTFED